MSTHWKQIPNEVAEMVRNPPPGCMAIMGDDGEVKIVSKVHFDAALKLAFKAAMKTALTELGFDDFDDALDLDVKPTCTTMLVTIVAPDGRSASASAPIDADGVAH